MRVVSEEGETVLMKLIAWEMLGRDDFDPKVLLRRLSFTDLATVQRNINESLDRVKDFISVQMVELEMLFRRGFLVGDWTCSRRNSCMTLSYNRGPGMVPWPVGQSEARA